MKSSKKRKEIVSFVFYRRYKAALEAVVVNKDPQLILYGKLFLDEFRIMFLDIKL